MYDTWLKELFDFFLSRPKNQNALKAFQNILIRHGLTTIIRQVVMPGPVYILYIYIYIHEQQ